ncbi:hypothetical protein [Methylomicrobium lacus]|uniref:hypothetical protein n=1 Tax=Methylomicrobium lacus TaxID=136992 RepID=UPI0035A8CC70
MQGLDVDGLQFDFPDDWLVGKYDEWSFYRNQFCRIKYGIKALDLLAIDPSKTAWLIEVKDYRVNSRTKPSDLSKEVVHKVFDTLSAMIPAKIHATGPIEKQLARAIATANNLRVVLHLEQPEKHSKLRPRAINLVDVKQKIRQLLNPIDAHPLVVDAASRCVDWQVSL